MPKQPDHAALLRQAARQLRHALSPSAFAREACAFNPDPWQARVLDGGAKRVALVCARQSGKSSVAAMAAAHTALFQPGSLTLIAASNARQSGELFAKARGFLSASKMLPARLPSDNAMSCELPSGSRIVALPGDSPDAIRGFSKPAAAIIDEAAFCDDGLLTAIMPSLSVSNGRLLLLSTPNGKRGAFYEIVSSAPPDWQIERITAAQCPRITQEAIEEFTRIRGPHAARAEFGCEFIEASDQYFADDAIAAILSASLPLLNVTF